MPNDPKWRTIARASKQRIGDVLAMFNHLMVDASQRGANASERGRTQMTDEDIASALDLTGEDVAAIRQAMQGRVLDGDRLLGWSKRQPIREDDSAERARAWREEQKAKAEAERIRTHPNAPEQKRTLDSDADSDAEDSVGKASTHPSGIEGEGGGGATKAMRPEVAMTVAMRKAGCPVTSANPTLVEAVAEGVTIEHVLDMIALYPGKPSGYVLGACRRERAEPAQAVTTTGKALAKPRQVQGHSADTSKAVLSPEKRYADDCDYWNGQLRQGFCDATKAAAEIAKARAKLEASR